MVACALRSVCSLSGRGDGLRDARCCDSLLVSGRPPDVGCGCATPGPGAAGRAAAAKGVLLLASPARLAARGPLRCHCCGHLAADTPSAAGEGLGSLQWASLFCSAAAAGAPLRWRYSSSSRCAFARSSTTSRSCAVANLASRAAASACRALGTHTGSEAWSARDAPAVDASQLGSVSRTCWLARHPAMRQRRWCRRRARLSQLCGAVAGRGRPPRTRRR